MSRTTMPKPSKKRALELGAQFLERDLDEMRQRAQVQWEEARERPRKQCPQGCTPGNAVDPESEGVPSPCHTCKGTAYISTAYINDWDGRELPLSTSLEGDLMKAVEWAWAAATLRAMAAQED